MDKIEIEIKLPLLNDTEVTDRLNKEGIFKHETKQLDYYYNAPHRNFVENPNNICEWIRLRVSNGKYELNYKDWLPHEETKKTHCTEYETEVLSIEDMRSILAALGFKHLITVDKIRKVWMLNNIEVSIDKIDSLGSFIELEYKGNERKDVLSIRKVLLESLKNLNAKTKELDLKGYPYLMLEKEGYFSI